MLLNLKISQKFGLTTAIFFLILRIINAQDTGNDVKGEKKAVWRLGFWEVLHQTFSDDESHPFYQMTGTNRFRAGKGFFGTTFIDLDSFLLF